MVSTDLVILKDVLEQIRTLNQNASHNRLSKESNGFKEFHIIVTPTLPHSFDVLLEEEGLYGLVQFHRFNWDFIALDSNVLSLEITQFFKQLYLKEESTLVSSVAQSLRIFNMVFKKPSLILTYGDYSDKIVQMIDRLDGTNESLEPGDPEFSTMLLIDRNKDYPSCLLTPIVYSGLLLEVFTSKSGVLQIDVEHNKIKAEKLHYLNVPKQKGSCIKPADITHLRMSSANDSVFQENRYKHVSEVISVLSSQAKVLGTESSNLKDMQLSEMQEYVTTKLPKVASQKKELFKHLILCETIVNELGADFERLQNIEESMIKNENRKQILHRIQEKLHIDPHKLNCLRQFCLYHLTCTLSLDEASNFMKNYLHAFGYQYLSIFPPLIKASLFPDPDSVSGGKASALLTNIPLPKFQNRFQSTASKLKLIPSVAMTAGPSDPQCPSYVFNGSYIPLVAQLLNFLCTSYKFEDFQGKLAQLDHFKAHRYFDKKNKTLAEIGNAIKLGVNSDIFALNKINKIFVFINGGITYAEIAACNLVERLTGKVIVIGGTSIISGSDIVEAAFLKVYNDITSKTLSKAS